MSDACVHLIQGFVAEPEGGLSWDPLLWSTDGGFAPLLARALASRRAGVLHLRTALTADGRPGEVSELISSVGWLPTDLFVRREAPSLAVEIERGRLVLPRPEARGPTSRSS